MVKLAEIRKLDEKLIYQANNNSMMGKRGDISKSGYESYAEDILSWPISEEKKQSLLDKLYEKWSRLLEYEASHVSVAVAGPSKYNARKLDKADRILELSHEIYEWFCGLKEQIKQGTAEDNRKVYLKDMIDFCRKPDNPCDPTPFLAELASYDNAEFIRLYEEMYPDYKWRKNSTIVKLYEASKAGKVKEIKKEVFFQDDNLTAYTEGDRAYIKFILKPKRQLIVAMKSRGWWWNSRKAAWSTYLDKLDREWVSSISTRYASYV